MMCYLNRGSTFYFRFIIIKGIGVRPIPFCTYLSMYFTRASFKLFSHCFFPFNGIFILLTIYMYLPLCYNVHI